MHFISLIILYISLLCNKINPIQLSYTFTTLEISYKGTKRMEIVKLNVVVCYLFH